MIAIAAARALDVLGAVVIVIVSLLEPDDGETVAHEALLLAVQLMFDVMINSLCSPEAMKLAELVEADK